MTFARRLVFGSAVVALVAVTTLAWTTELALRGDLESEIGSALAREARLVRSALPQDTLAWQDVLHQYASATGHRITLIDRAGNVRADSDFPTGPLPLLENHSARPEVKTAFGGGEGTSVRRSVSVGRDLLYVAVPGGPGVVRIAADLSQVNAIVRRAQGAVLIAALVALLVGGLVSVLSARAVSRPLTEIGAAAREIASGGQPRFPHSGIDDIDELVRALRQMHGQLGDRFEELRREKAESAALVESMVEGVIASDARGRVVTANRAARTLLGYADGAPLPGLQELFRAKPAREIVRAALAGEREQARQLEMDGRTFLVNTRALPGGGALLVLHELTEIRRLETVRRDFVANVSHELKTPLTSISGFAETMLTDDMDGETRQRFLGIILTNARRMQRLVDDLLDLSRIEAGRWQPEPAATSIETIGREVWSALAERAAAGGVQFDIAVAPDAAVVSADPDALRQIVTNLVENSLRHTPARGRITLCAQREGGGTVVEVADTGSGIAREHLPRIFERFYRADASRSRDEGGTGLGLAIVKHLVESHGGRVWATSERGTGTVVSAWFPSA